MVPIGSSVYYALMLKEETSMENNFILPIGRLKSQSGSEIGRASCRERV